MPPIDPQRDPSGFAIASGAILAGLLDLLVTKGTLTRAEVRSVLIGAMRDISPRLQDPKGYAASQTIQDLIGQFSEGNV